MPAKESKKPPLPAAAAGGGAASSPHLSAVFGRQPPGSNTGSCPTLSREDVEQAFRFLDVRGRGVLQAKDLKERLGVFYPMMTNKEYRFLITEPRFTVDSLWNLLQHQTLQSFDPIREAFRVYDPKDTGYVDKDALSNIMRAMGYGKVTPEDVEVIIRTADADRDGKISLEDFRKMIAAQSGELSAPQPPAAGSPEAGVTFGDAAHSPSKGGEEDAGDHEEGAPADETEVAEEGGEAEEDDGDDM